MLDYLTIEEWAAARTNWWRNQPPGGLDTAWPWERKCELCGVVMDGPFDCADRPVNGVWNNYRQWFCKRCGALHEEQPFAPPDEEPEYVEVF